MPAVAQGWSPYSNGRWVWQANDYVWLSFDPWYAPFHYGRWNWGGSIGWFWVAPRGRAYWSPGYVGWSIDEDEVSWVPLGRNEVYYGYGNYGPSNVNVSKVTTINITNVYINSRVNNGIVVVKRNNFLQGKIVHERVAASKNPFQGGPSGVKILGKPPVQEIKPIRETKQSRPVAEIKRNSLPPARAEIESKTIKARVVAPTKEKSVFKPGVKPAPLKNLVKEKELQQWVAPKKAPAAKTVVAPTPTERPKNAVAPVKPAPPAVQNRAVQPPVGKHLFKREPEPQGGANVAPAPNVAPVRKVAPEEKPQGEKDKQPSEDEDKKGNERGGGKGK